MSPREPVPPLPFSEEEMLRALRLALPEEQAMEMAREWGGLPARIERGEAIGWGLADGSLILLSLLGGETARKVDEEYVSRLSEDERARFREQREAVRRKLEAEGGPRGDRSSLR